MAEQLPDDVLPITCNGEPFNVDRFNTTLYTFIGELGMYNHVFIRTSDEESEDTSGGFAFQCAPPDNPVFQQLASFVLEHNFPMVLNMTRVPPCDRDAFMEASLTDLGGTDFIPDEWAQPN